MSVSEQTKTVSARLSIEQYEALQDHIGSEPQSEYIRRLIAEDFDRAGLAFPEYEWVDNDMRKALGIRGRGEPPEMGGSVSNA